MQVSVCQGNSLCNYFTTAIAKRSLGQESPAFWETWPYVSSLWAQPTSSLYVLGGVHAPQPHRKQRLV